MSHAAVTTGLMRARIAVTVRPFLQAAVAEEIARANGEPLVLPWPRDGKEFRYFLHQQGPDGVVADAQLGAGRWHAISEWGFVQGVRANRGGPPDLIGLFDYITERERRRARLAGCAAVIDLSDETWRASLGASLALVRVRPVIRLGRGTRLGRRRQVGVEPLQPKLQLVR